MELISRQAVRLIESDSDAYPQEWNDDYEKGFTDALNKVLALPSAQPERPKGEWIHIRDEEDGNALYECSVCHKGEVHVPIVEVSYCWNCGADMRGEQDG